MRSHNISNYGFVTGLQGYAVCMRGMVIIIPCAQSVTLPGINK